MDKLTNLEKIEQWANENGYIVNYYSVDYITLGKTYKLETQKLTWHDTVYMEIHVDYDCKNFVSFINLEVASRYRTKDQLEELFIPFNRVKRDEKLLREYLEDGEKKKV